jgi:PAS domain-containing protein
MSLTENRAARARTVGRRVLLVIGAAAIVFAGLAMTGALAAALALAGFGIIAAAALVAIRNGGQSAQLSPVLAVSERADDPLRTIVAGLPDPVIALDRDGRVLARNEPARALAPALRLG